MTKRKKKYRQFEEINPISKQEHFLTNLTNKKAIVFIIIIGVVVFSNGLFNHFVFDDDGQIVRNAYIHSIKNIPFFFGGGTFYTGGSRDLIGTYYRPLVSSLFATIYTFFGEQAFGFHFLQLVLHILSACILFLFFKKLFPKQLALILTLVFLVHPINSEAVFYVSNTQETLFFFFGMLSLYLLSKNLKSIKYILLSTFLLLLSLLSKETGVLFMLIGVVYIIITNKKQLLKFVGCLAPAIMLYMFLRKDALGFVTSAPNAPINKLDLLTRLINGPSIFWFYLKTFIFPVRLASSYQWVHTNIDLIHFVYPLVADLVFIFAILFTGVFIYKKYSREALKIYLFFFVWFLLGILLHLQIIPLDATVADRWFYFPIVGLLGMIGVLIKESQVAIEKKRNLVIIILIISLLSIRTFIRSFDWRDQLTLASHDIVISKEAYGLENVIALELLKRGKTEEAKIHAQKSAEIYPYHTNYNTLGLVYIDLGEYQKSKEAYFKALDYGDSYLVYENLGGLAMVYGDADENIKFIQEALKKFPQNSRLWLYLAILQYQRGNKEDAKTAIALANHYNDTKETQYIYSLIMNDKPLDLKFTTSSH